MGDQQIAMFELTEQEGRIVVLDERHYELVPSDLLSVDELKSYGVP